MAKRWKGRPALAMFLRVLLFVAPGIAAWLAVRSLSPLFFEVEGSARLPTWIVQAVVVSLVAAKAVGVAAQRLVPLPALLALTLVFPDEAPSRFGVALRSGSTKKLVSGIVELPQDEGAAAREAIELVASFNRHDRLTRGHMERVRAYSELIGAEMGLPDQELNLLRWGTLLHDVGKLAVPPEILNKPGRPTSEEWEILKTHPAAGGQLLQPLVGFLGPWADAATDHHERWDGSGYPNGKAGTEISLAGRICAVADAYDVITSKRSYKQPQSAELARNELAANAGTQFDPIVVRSFLRVGLTQGNRTGLLGWLFELPQVLRFATAAVSIPAAVAVGAFTATVATAGDFANSAPDSLAFEEPTIEVPQSTTVPTTITPTTTGSPTTTTTPNTTTTTTAAPTTTTLAPTTTTVAPTTTTLPPDPVATGTGFTFLEPTQVGSLLPGVHRDRRAIVFYEGGPFPTPWAMSLRTYGGALRGAEDFDEVTYPAGSQLCSWILQADPNGTVNVDIDFGQPVLGTFPVSGSQFANLPGIDYALQHGVGTSDFFFTSGSQISAVFTEPGTAVDLVRIFTSC